MAKPLIVAALALWPSLAFAVPPPPNSPDAASLDTEEKRQFVARQHDRDGRWCCDAGDYAVVDIRIEDNGDVWVKAKHPDKARGIPEGWQKVESEERIVDLRGQKSVLHEPAAWFYHDKVQCVLPGDQW